jgi:hypothetical protein
MPETFAESDLHNMGDINLNQCPGK